MSKIINFGEVVEGYTVKVLNEREARAGAGILFLLGLISFINCSVTKSLWVTQIFISIFLIEFIIRVLINPKYAPSLIIGRFMVNNQIPEYVGASQKRFAWSIGLGLAIFLFTLTILFPTTTPIGEESLHNALIGLSCMTCLLLLYFESVFGICLGCKLYNKFNADEAKYCAGGVCQKEDRQECQKVSLSQIAVLIVFFAFLIVAITFLVKV
ncbi:hypothetical protein MNB_SV-13-2153 [hydrothermal vent metagenome]|uniref:DUF4395 domain-containing protein n=1 Tax=hydrothermal vent metagenome TaxID=652676 RepID=A0A1W1CZ69_9ZZZZ